MTRLKLVLASYLVLFSIHSYALTEEQIKHETELTTLAKQRCDTELISGKDYKIKVNADGMLEVSFFGKKGGELKGKFVYTKKEWEGRQMVLKENQANENMNRRECLRSELNSLRRSYDPPKSNDISLKKNIRYGAVAQIKVNSDKSRGFEKVYITSNAISVDEAAKQVMEDCEKENNFGCAIRETFSGNECLVAYGKKSSFSVKTIVATTLEFTIQLLKEKCGEDPNKNCIILGLSCAEKKS